MPLSKLQVVCSVAVAPLRKEASDASEMVSQLLLGETAKIEEKLDRWIKVTTDLDHYTGWISVAQVIELDERAYQKWVNDSNRKISEYHAFSVEGLDGNQLIVPAGSMVSMTETGLLRLPFGVFEVRSELELIKATSPLDTAFHFKGVPYMWGGRSEFGIDCSGFVQLVMLLHGDYLPRDAWQQAKEYPFFGTSLEEAIPGDIIYFANEKGKVFHIGFYAGDGLLLHASGQVKIENIDPKKREQVLYAFNERLCSSICGIQRIPAGKSS